MEGETRPGRPVVREGGGRGAASVLLAESGGDRELPFEGGNDPGVQGRVRGSDDGRGGGKDTVDMGGSGHGGSVRDIYQRGLGLGDAQGEF